MASIVNNKFWKEFITIYRELPELWELKNEKYKNKSDKHVAWEKLVEKMKEVEPCATQDFVKRKINAMRSCYRREYKKVRKSEKSGGKLIHVPTLWYYEEFSFLRDQKIESEEVVFNTDLDEDDDYVEEEVVQKVHKRKKLDLIDQNKEFSHKPIENVEEINSNRTEGRRDEADIFAESWAVIFRKLTPDQKIYAKKAIDDILVEGQLGRLQLNSFQCSSAHTGDLYTSTSEYSVQSPPTVHPLKLWHAEPQSPSEPSSSPPV